MFLNIDNDGNWLDESTTNILGTLRNPIANSSMFQHGAPIAMRDTDMDNSER